MPQRRTSTVSSSVPWAKSSQDLTHILEFTRNPDSSAYNDNSFNTMGSQNHNTGSNNIINSGNVLNNISITDDRSEMLAWLSPLEPYIRHHDIQTRRVSDVGDWLLRTEEFRSWHRGDGDGRSQRATIFCPGNPGVGKTYIR